MMIRRLFILAMATLLYDGLHAQYAFVDKGRILFERKVNTYAVVPALVV